MGLFGNTKKDEQKHEEAVPQKVEQAANTAPRTPVNLAQVLVKPHITEKASENMARGVYVFEVSPRANKKDIAAAVRAIYKVEPQKIRVVPMSYKRVRHARTGQWGVKGGGKKAYVYLKDGDSISVM